MNPRVWMPVLIAALLAWSIYRRVRRSIGRQLVHEGRLWFRAGLLGVIGALLLVGSLAHPLSAEALVTGFAAGALLAWLGLRHTQFETTPQGRFYTPHTAIGLVVSGLFIGRLVYRFVFLAQNVQPDTDPLAAIQRSPLTLAIGGVVIGYYVLFNLGVLRRSRASQ